MFTPEALASYVSLAIITCLNLLVAYVILKHFLFRPILKLLRRRRQLIADDMQQAGEKLVQAKERLDQAEEKLEASTHEAADILAEAKSQAEKQSEAVLKDARRTAAGMVTRAETEVSRMRITMLNDVRNEVADLAVSVAAKVIGQAMDEQRQRELVDQYLAENLQTKETGNRQGEVSAHE